MHVTASETKRSVRAICRRFDISRAAFYKAAKARSRKEVNEELILALVRQEREVNPCAGTKKVLVAIRPELQKAGFNIGKNRLNDLLKREGLLIDRAAQGVPLPHDEAGSVARAVAEPRQGHGNRQT